jgi:hypothetical protein
MRDRGSLDGDYKGCCVLVCDPMYSDRYLPASFYQNTQRYILEVVHN